MPRSQTRHSLANQILDIVRNARLEAGHHLREQWLGDRLGVSRTPIRAALDLLAERGAVETRKNQGFFLVQSFDALQRLQVEVPSSAEQSLYKQLVRDRLAGKLPGSVTQSEIAKRYDVDRGVLMRALSRLAEDNLVARNKGHGWRFLPTLATDVALRNSYEFRLAIEPAGILLDSFRPNPAVIERCRLQHMVLLSNPDLGSVDSAQLFETDVAFHEALALASGNRILTYLFEAMASPLQESFYLTRRGHELRGHTPEHTIAAHQAILKFVRQGDAHGAAEAMRTHLQDAERDIRMALGSRTAGLRG